MDTLAMLLPDKERLRQGHRTAEQGAGTAAANNAGFKLNLAKIYIKAGDKGKAKTELDTLAKLGDKFPANRKCLPC